MLLLLKWLPIVQIHEEAYVTAFCGSRLDDSAAKRIGFGDVVRAPVLVERTLAEVAGTHCAGDC